MGDEWPAAWTAVGGEGNPSPSYRSVKKMKRGGRGMGEKHARQPYSATLFFNSVERACQTPIHSQKGLRGSTPLPAEPHTAPSKRKKSLCGKRGQL